MVKNLILSTALCGILPGGVAWAESEGDQVKQKSKELYDEVKQDGTQVESTSKEKTEVRSDDDSGAASSTETKTESTVRCTEHDEFNKETGKCE
jgi:hypothetical protein